MTALGDISAVMRHASPVFIVGEARSGTSMLYRTLQKHPAFAPRTPNLVETELFAHLPRTFQFNATYPQPWRRFMLDDAAAWAAFLRTIRVPKVASLALAPATYLLRDRLPWLWRASLGHLVLRSFAFHATQARGCRRLVEKTPTHTRHLAQLTSAFPRCRLLYVHRHPVDVYSSYRRRAGVDPGGGWADLEVAEFCRRWESSTLRVLQWLGAGHTNLHRVRYETFTADPADAFREVCAFLGEPFEEAAILESRPDPDRWPVDPHLWGEIVARTKDWRDHIGVGEAAAVQRTLAPTMRRLGYEPYPLDG